ncbi:MAG: BCCT family transporter, partial [Eubacterium sp.]
AVTWIMMSVGEGITGIKMLSNIGGLPAMILIILVVVSAIMIAKNPEKYNIIDKIKTAKEEPVNKDS